MGTFAVSANDELVASCKELVDELSQGKKQSEGLAKMAAIVKMYKDGEVMKQGGINVEALDASLSNIRCMFIAASTSNGQILEKKDAKIADLKNLKDQMESDLRSRISAAEEEKKLAVASAEAAAKAAAQAVKDAQAAKEQADIANRLVTEKDKTIATLSEKLSASEEKAKGYDDLIKAEEAARMTIADLHRAMEDLKKDQAVQIRDLTAKMERALSDARKDADLDIAKAVADKDKEMTAQLHDADREIVRLQTTIEALEARISDLTDKTVKDTET